jgi:hypothetical protein
MPSIFQSSSHGLRTTNQKFFENDIYVPNTVTDATVDVSIASEKLQATSYGGGQVTLSIGYDQDSLAGAQLQYTTNGSKWTALNTNGINHSELHTFKIPVVAGNYVNVRHTVAGKTILLKQATGHYNVPPRR